MSWSPCLGMASHTKHTLWKTALSCSRKRPPEPFLKACPTNRHGLTNELLARMATKLCVHLRMETKRTALLRALARAASDGDEECVVEALAVDVLPMGKPIATRLDDPKFEVAYEEMPDDGTLEFPELQEEMKQGRTRRRLADSCDT